MVAAFKELTKEKEKRTHLLNVMRAMEAAGTKKEWALLQGPRKVSEE